jgi:peroxiredoxin
LALVAAVVYLYGNYKAQRRAIITNIDGSRTLLDFSRLDDVRLFDPQSERPVGLTRTAPRQLFIFFSPGDCSSCLDEFRVWQELSKVYAPSQLQIVGVIVKSSPAEAQDFFKTYSPNFDLYLDKESDVESKIGLPKATPLKALVDERGRLLLVSGPNGKNADQLAFAQGVMLLMENAPSTP